MTSFHGGNVFRTGGAGLLASLLFLTPVLAGNGGVRERIEARLAKAGLQERGDVQVEMRDGVAVLSGFTLTLDARRAAEKAARKEAGSVENRLRVLPEKRTDAEVQEAVASAILRDPYYGVFDSVGVAVEDGAVTLVGSVNRPWRKDDLDRRVAKVEGVRELRNEIRVQPVSSFDDRLRLQLYRRIYGSGTFARYASFPDPPVRIVVENGRITLTGIVNSNVERVLLGSIARGTLAFAVDNQVQVESEIRKEPVRRTTPI